MIPFRSNPIQEATYRSEKSDKEKTWYVQITSGTFVDCVFKYVDWRFIKTGPVVIGPATAAESKYHLQFKFILLHYPDKWRDPDGVMLDTTNKELMSLLGNILLELATDDFQEQKRDDDLNAAMENIEDNTVPVSFSSMTTAPSIAYITNPGSGSSITSRMATIQPPPRKL